ncbi:hypothetical protein K502DRAFT_353642 [Neoconidiobolus thromboides FSU 785]|nr:hypothetical protein K502DRAFT_353642 [Neoconidiobolus thromboides FSU 785]
MSKPILMNGTRIRSACDLCYINKKRCDLILPICSNCKEVGGLCTRLRKNQRKPRMYNNEDFHSKTFILFQSAKLKREKKKEGIISLNYKYFQQLKMELGGTRFNSNNSIASVFPIKFFHSPILFDQRSYAFYKVAPNQCLSLLYSKMPKFDEKVGIINKNISIFNIMPQLIMVYFQRVNILLPLFTYNQFLSKTRDSVLIYSMMLAALAQVDESDTLSGLKTFLKNKLLVHFKPNRLKVNLSNIQSMVVLLNGLKGSSSALPSYYFSNLHSYCILLGLHVNYKDNSERKLCYSAIVYLLSINDPYCNLAFDSHNLWKKDMTAPKLNKEKAIEEIMQSIVSTYSNFFYNCGLFYKHFFDTLLHIDTLNINNAKVVKMNQILVKLLNSTTETAVSKLQMIKQSISNKLFNVYIDTVTNHIKVIYHSSSVSLFDIRCIASSNNKDSLFSINVLDKKPKDLHLLKTNIQQLLIYNSNLNLDCFSSIRFYMFLTAIHALQSYSKWIDDSNVLLEELLNQLNKLAKNQNERLVLVINLMVQAVSSK